MKDEMEWYINGQKVENHKIKFDSIPYISIVLKGKVRPDTSYAILHNDIIVITIKAQSIPINPAYNNGPVVLRSMISIAALIICVSIQRPITHHAF